MSQMATPVAEPDQEAANILLRTPSITANADRTCARLQAADTEPLDRCLWITYTRSPDEILAEWRRHGGDPLPDQTGVIVVGDHARAAGVPDSAIPAGSAPPAIETVANPTDLTGLGTNVNEFCEAWGATDGRFSICFDSLTPLLVYVSVDRACRFLHALTARVETLEATAHYHLTPSVHAARTARRLTGLFDDVVDLSETGDAH